MEKYVVQSGRKPTSPAEGPSAQQFLSEIANYHTILVNIKEIIENSFSSGWHRYNQDISNCCCLARAYSKHFNEFANVYLFGKEWSIEKYKETNPSLEHISKDLAKFTKWSQDMNRQVVL